MPFLSLATVVVEFFTFLMQKLDWSFDILNKKEWNQLNCSSLSFYGDILILIFYFFSLASWTLRPLRLVRKISGTLVEDALKMPTHQSWTESKWCTATCCITSNPTATTCLRTLFGLSCFFFLGLCIFTTNLKLILLTCLLVMSWRVQQKKTKTPSLSLRHLFPVELVQRSL